MVDLGARHGDCGNAHDEPAAARGDHRGRGVRRLGAARRCAVELGVSRVCHRRPRGDRRAGRVADRARRSVRHACPLPCPRAASAVGHAGNPDRRPGVARRAAGRVLRRVAARDVDPVHRRRKRAREPEATAEVGAERAARSRRLDHGGAHGRAAARRERTPRAPRAKPAWRKPGGASPRQADRHPGDDRRARPFDPARSSDGRARARSRDRDEDLTAGGERRVDARRPVWRVRGRVRLARRDDARGTRSPDARARHHRRDLRPRHRGWRSAHHPLPARSVAHSRVARRGLGRVRRRGTLPCRPREPPEPQPLAPTAAVADPARGPAARGPGRRASRLDRAACRRLAPRREPAGARITVAAS